MKLPQLFSDTIQRWHKRSHYGYQHKITETVLMALVHSRTGEGTYEIPIQLPRQCGKTTAIVDVVEFILAASLRYFGSPMRIGVFAPEKEQATTDFDRLKIQFLEIADLGFMTKIATKKGVAFPEKWNSKTIRIFKSTEAFLGEVYIFPISKNSNPESKTLDLIIIEEAQDVDDEKMKKAVFPMGASTNAPRIYIGTAGTRNCYFKEQLDNNPRAVKIGIRDVFAERRAVAEKTGDPRHLLYERFVENEIAFHGEDADYIQTQYFGKWMIGSGQFTVAEELDALEDKERGLIEENKAIPVDPKDPKKGTKQAWPCYVGVDTAKNPDQTVVTVLRRNKDKGKTELCGWLALHGDNYEDQFTYITGFLKPFENIRRVALDATGQGDFMPDKFERHTRYNLERVKFSAESKDVMYKNLMQAIKNKLTTLPKLPLDNKHRKQFRKEMLELEKEYKGRYLSVHHPDGKSDAHDDYADSWALAEYALMLDITKEPNIR